MRLVRVVLLPPSHMPCPPLDLPAVVAQLHRAARPGDRLEHLSANVEPGRLHLGFFLATADAEAATRAVDRICRVALRCVALRGWSRCPTSGRAHP